MHIFFLLLCLVTSLQGMKRGREEESTSSVPPQIESYRKHPLFSLLYYVPFEKALEAERRPVREPLLEFIRDIGFVPRSYEQRLLLAYLLAQRKEIARSAQAEEIARTFSVELREKFYGWLRTRNEINELPAGLLSCLPPTFSEGFTRVLTCDTQLSLLNGQTIPQFTACNLPQNYMADLTERFGIANQDRFAVLYNFGTGARQPLAGNNVFGVLSLSSTGLSVASHIPGQSAIEIRHVPDLRLLKTYAVPKPVKRVQWDYQGNRIFALCQGGYLYYESEKGDKMKALGNHPGAHWLCANQQGNKLLTACPQFLHIWTIPAGVQKITKTTVYSFSALPFVRAFFNASGMLVAQHASADEAGVEIYNERGVSIARHTGSYALIEPSGNYFFVYTAPTRKLTIGRVDGSLVLTRDILLNEPIISLNTVNQHLVISTTAGAQYALQLASLAHLSLQQSVALHRWLQVSNDESGSRAFLNGGHAPSLLSLDAPSLAYMQLDREKMLSDYGQALWPWIEGLLTEATLNYQELNQLISSLDPAVVPYIREQLRARILPGCKSNSTRKLFLIYMLLRGRFEGVTRSLEPIRLLKQCSRLPFYEILRELSAKNGLQFLLDTPEFVVEDTELEQLLKRELLKKYGYLLPQLQPIEDDLPFLGALWDYYGGADMVPTGYEGYGLSTLVGLVRERLAQFQKEPNLATSPDISC